MKFPEIDPELHGLLDEVVTDPRSALRRTPRHALLRWFGNPDSAHARPIDATTAERHLVAVYRESLAEIFRESALVAYYQAPFRSHPRRTLTGEPVPTGPLVESLRRKSRKAEEFASRWAERSPVHEFLALLRARLPDGPAVRWAEMSVSLAPTDFGRFVHAIALPVSQHHEAIGLLQRLGTEARGDQRLRDIHSQLAVRMAALGWNALARDQYDHAIACVPDSPGAYIYGFNLSIFMQDERAAVAYSRSLESLVVEEERIAQSIAIIAEWAHEQRPSDVAKARALAARIAGRLCPSLARLSGAWQQ